MSRETYAKQIHVFFLVCLCWFRFQTQPGSPEGQGKGLPLLQL